MDMLVDIKDLSIDLSELITGLLSLGKKIDMEVRVHLHSEKRKKRIAILVSKEPHCLQQLVGDFAAGKLHGDIAAVLANHPDLEGVTKQAGLAFEHHKSDDPAKHFSWLGEKLRKLNPDLIVLARYMRILPPEIVKSWPSRIINIHPSL